MYTLDKTNRNMSMLQKYNSFYVQKFMIEIKIKPNLQAINNKEQDFYIFSLVKKLF